MNLQQVCVYEKNLWFFSEIWTFLKISGILKEIGNRGKFSRQPVTKYHNVFAYFSLTMRETKLDYDHHKLPHELPNNLKFRILGHEEILEKSQTCV